jgi:hypothetical protein
MWLTGWACLLSPSLWHPIIHTSLTELGDLSPWRSCFFSAQNLILLSVTLNIFIGAYFLHALLYFMVETWSLPIPRILSILFTLFSDLCLFWFIMPDLSRLSVILSHSWVCFYRFRFQFFPNIFFLNMVKCNAGFNRSLISHIYGSHCLNCRKTFTQSMAAVA